MQDNTNLILTPTNNEITVFQNDQFGSVRTIIRDGEPWFVAADVCRALELGDTHKAVERLDDDEKGRSCHRRSHGLSLFHFLAQNHAIDRSRDGSIA